MYVYFCICVHNDSLDCLGRCIKDNLKIYKNKYMLV